MTAQFGPFQRVSSHLTSGCCWLAGRWVADRVASSSLQALQLNAPGSCRCCTSCTKESCRRCIDGSALAAQTVPLLVSMLESAHACINISLSVDGGCTASAAVSGLELAYLAYLHSGLPGLKLAEQYVMARDVPDVVNICLLLE